jgi:hypothetical protein
VHASASAQSASVVQQAASFVQSESGQSADPSQSLSTSSEQRPISSKPKNPQSGGQLHGFSPNSHAPFPQDNAQSFGQLPWFSPRLAQQVPSPQESAPQSGGQVHWFS